MKFTRETYEKIKKLDRKQMEAFYTSVWNEGFSRAEGMFDTVLRETKGIGAVKMDSIKKSIEEKKKSLC